MADGLLPAALALAARGWRVHPIHPILPGGACGCGSADCAAAGKHPRLTVWQRAASADSEQVRKWWSARPGDGIGVATGPGSGVVVVDLDPRHGGDASFAAALRERGERLETLRVRTGGGGWHLYFVAPPRRIGNRAGVLPGVDVRGAGGYVVGPGSPHVSGQTYVLDRDVAPLPMPDWLVELCASRPATAPRPAPTPITSDDRERRYALAALDHAQRRIAETTPGGRHDAVVREAYAIGGYVGAGLLSEAVARAGLTEAALACGLGEREAMRAVEDALAAGAAAPTRAPTRPEPDPRPRQIERPDEPPSGEGSPPDVPHPADDPLAEEERIFDRGDQVELGCDLLDRLGRAATAYDEGGVRHSNGAATWDLLHDLDLERRAHGYAGRRRWGPIKNGQRTTVAIAMSATAGTGVVRVLQAQAHNADFFAGAPRGAAFAGTFARVEGARVVLEPLRPEHRVRSEAVSPFELAPEGAPAPLTHALLARTWDGLPDLGERVRYLFEWLGLALVGLATQHKDSPLLTGGQDTGKSRVLDVVQGVFPAAARRHVPLHELAHEYSRAYLVGARLNVVNELPARSVLDAEAAKALLSGDAVTARHPAGRVFSLRSRCAHIFAANELPPAADRALVRRFVLLDCPHRVPEAEQDHDLGAKLALEAPAVARLALSSLEGVLARGRLLRPSTSHDLATEWVDISDSVSAWVRERVARTPQPETAGATLYEDYRRWCETHGHKPCASNRWGTRLRAMGFDRARGHDANHWPMRLLGPAQAAAQQRWGFRPGADEEYP